MTDEHKKSEDTGRLSILEQKKANARKYQNDVAAAKAAMETLTYALHDDNTPLMIHPGTGKDTGMKWLEDKKICLVVAANEGYCRD